MDSELKQYLEGMESRLSADIQQVRSEIQQVETGLRAEIQQVEERLRAHTSQECEKVETKLMTELWKWGRTSDVRTRQSMENANALNERMLNVEDRISNLERNRMPPRADA